MSAIAAEALIKKRIFHFTVNTIALANVEQCETMRNNRNLEEANESFSAENKVVVYIPVAFSTN